ncbi:MAG: DUF971 domain-containing protein [Planctomycetota bacterium]
MAHQPIQFGPADDDTSAARRSRDDLTAAADESAVPVDLDLKKDRALTVKWDDGRVSVYPIDYLRKMSPSAEAKALREEMAKNPLTVLPASAAGGGETLTATGAELIGNYALRVEFSDGHRTGLFTWAYLREIDPERPGSDDGRPADPDRAVRP